MLKNIDSVTEDRRLVLLYVRGAFHFPLIEPLVRHNPDIEFFLHSNLFGNGEVERSGLLAYANFHFTSGLDEIKYKLNQFGAFITTDAEPANPHSYSLRLIEFFHAIGVPVFELQHGLFQLGLHYYDVPHGCHFGGDSLLASSFADNVLAYYPPTSVETPCTAIGYPPFSGQKETSKGSDWTLVLSNLHWPTYTNEERRSFYESVYRLAAEGPSPVVWKLHHGEIGSQRCNVLRKELAAKYPQAAGRLRFHHEDALLRDLKLGTLIVRAGNVISTVSTVLLDCEMQNKRVAIFSCPSVACLIDKLARKDVFSTTEELFALLSRGPERLVTGHLLPYDNGAFRNALDASYRETTLSRKEYLSAVFNLLQPLNSELRWNLVTLRKEVESAKTALKMADAAAVREIVAKEVGALEKRVGELCGREEDLRSAQDALSGIRDELESARKEKTAETVRAVSAEALAAGLKSECAFLRSTVDERDRAVARGESSLTAAQGELKKAQDVADSLRQLVEKLRGELARELSRALAAETRIEELRVEREKFAAECDKLRVERADRIQRVEGLKSELATAKAGMTGLLSQFDGQRQTVSEMDKRLKKLTALVKEERDLRRPAKRVKRLVKGLLPYGAVCLWKRMAYGIREDDCPLPGNASVVRKCGCAVRGLFPYGLVRIAKEFHH